eukprot:g2804.t1
MTSGVNVGAPLTAMEVEVSDRAQTPLLSTDLAMRRATRCGGGVYALLLLNAALLIAVLVKLPPAAPAPPAPLNATNLMCASECSSVCLANNDHGSCYATCYASCVSRYSVERPSVLGPYLELKAVQHVGLTTSNLSRSVAFYTEVVGGVEVLDAGGPGWRGDDVYQLLMAHELWRGPPYSLYAANLSTDGPYALDARYINFGPLQLELLDYGPVDASMQGARFPLFPNTTAPSVATNMHISFDVRPDADLNKFVDTLETESHKRGFKNVECNRVVKVANYSEAVTASARNPKVNSYFVTTGPFRGWRLAYCKGPDNEQLEFNQVIENAKEDFQQAQAQYLTGKNNAMWRR